MSLVVAMQVRNDDLVFAADRRVTIGDPGGLVALDENAVKLFRFGPASLIGIVGMPGAVLGPIRQAITRLAAPPPPPPPSVPGAPPAPIPAPIDPSELLSLHLRQHYQQHYGLRPMVTQQMVQDSRPFAIVLYGDRRPRAEGLMQMASWDNFTPTPFPRPYAMAGVSQYANYLFQRFWRDDFTTDEALRLAAFLICETGRLDPKVGTVPDLMVLEAAGVRELPRAQVDAIVKDNEKRLDRFAKSFRRKP